MTGTSIEYHRQNYFRLASKIILTKYSHGNHTWESYPEPTIKAIPLFFLIANPEKPFLPVGGFAPTHTYRQAGTMLLTDDNL
jgi:hypothetical protein